MKIGILTFHRVYNYGAVLQSYALQKVIKQLGYDVEIIDYWCDYIYRPYSIENFKTKSFTDYIMGICGRIIYNFRKKKTKRFQKSIQYSPKVNQNNIKALNDRYDLFLVGSDQVWNYPLTNFDTTYLLDFITDNNKKVSYAASFGVKTIDDKYKETYAKLLSEFSSISVRESTGVSIVRELINKDVPMVADPVILLTSDEWESLAHMPKEKGYILVCQLGFSSSTINFVEMLSKKTNKKVISLPFPMGKFIPCKWGLTKGPADLIGLIKNADYIVTSSFHGALLSIMFEKKFFVEIPKNTAFMSTRIVELLVCVVK